MRTERMPWTCRWSEYRPGEPVARWMEEWLAQWACVVGRRRDSVSNLDRCAECGRWEPREGWTVHGQ